MYCDYNKITVIRAVNNNLEASTFKFRFYQVDNLII